MDLKAPIRQEQTRLVRKIARLDRELLTCRKKLDAVNAVLGDDESLQESILLEEDRLGQFIERLSDKNSEFVALLASSREPVPYEIVKSSWGFPGCTI